MPNSLDIAFFGSSLVSACWNGAATYYCGIIRALADRGHRVTFYEPDAYQRQQHRDLPDPDWAEVVVYSATETDDVYRCLDQAKISDVIVKASGVGAFDDLLEREVAALRSASRTTSVWDVDAPATLQRLAENSDDPFHQLIPQYDLVFTYGGGSPVVEAYQSRGAQQCVPIYNARDPATHYPAPAVHKFEGALSFLGNRLPDREARVREFFLRAAEHLPQQRFLLGGSGWEKDIQMPAKVDYLGHIYTDQHNAFNSTPMAVLNVSRESMTQCGYTPATRVFEAAGAGACLITDAWEGIELFLEPEHEVLVAETGEEVARHFRNLTPEKARRTGGRALRRVLSDHTYQQRAVDVENVLDANLIDVGEGTINI